MDVMDASQKDKAHQLNRNTIKRIKKSLVMEDDTYASLRPKFIGQGATSSHQGQQSA